MHAQQNGFRNFIGRNGEIGTYYNDILDSLKTQRSLLVVVMVVRIMFH